MHMQTPTQVDYKNPGLAAVLSFFFMGLGQIYNGQIAKGVAFIVIYAISWVMIVVLIGLLTTPVLWIYGMYDAYKSAERINRDTALMQQVYSQRQPPPSTPGS